MSRLDRLFSIAHQQNIIHRDLKPDNILFNNRGEALLADFGISAILGSMSMQLGTAIGTPPYMAPEQFKGVVSKEGDQYALGCIACKLFTGRRPFIAPDFWSMAFKHISEQPMPLTQLNKNIPVYIEQAVLKAMAKERTECYPNVTTFMLALRRTKEQLLNEANNHYHRSQYKEALVAFKEAIRLDANLCDCL